MSRYVTGWAAGDRPVPAGTPKGQLANYIANQQRRAEARARWDQHNADLLAAPTKEQADGTNDD